MRDYFLYGFAAIAAMLLTWNLHHIFIDLPPVIQNVGAYKIVYMHVSIILASFIGFFVSLAASSIYLATGNLKYDAFAAGVTEVAVVYATAGLALGSLWGRFAWGIWWTWDARLTSMLICWLMYLGYLMLRQAIPEPTERARLCAVLSIFGGVGVTFVYKSIEWYRTQHPAPVLSFRQGAGGMGPGLETPIYWNLLALLFLGTAMIMVRMRQEQVSREIDALRRIAHSHAA
ncbi:MAG: cytochrome c biogenesis protein CcsA [Acidobacteriota bacterium]